MQLQFNDTVEHSKNGILVVPADTPQTMPIGKASTSDPALPPKRSGELGLGLN